MTTAVPYKPPYAELTKEVLKCCFDVAKELGPGFLELPYQKALAIALQEADLSVQLEKPFALYFREQQVGLYVADLVVEQTAIVELKSCRSLIAEHQAQTINYLLASNLPVALLINFGHPKLQYKRFYHPLLHPDIDPELAPAPLFPWD